MVKKFMVECPCGFSFTTPHGEDDAVAVVQLHVQRIHKKDFPQGVSREEALKSIKEIGETHSLQSQIPVEKMGDVYEARGVEWGGLNVSFEKALADMDVTPFLKGLPDDLDQCPHWGFVFKGKIIVRYKDYEETINAGEAYYIAPRHSVIVTKGTELIEFSPLNEYRKTMEMVMKNAQAMEAKQGK